MLVIGIVARLGWSPKGSNTIVVASLQSGRARHAQR